MPIDNKGKVIHLRFTSSAAGNRGEEYCPHQLIDPFGIQQTLCNAITVKAWAEEINSDVLFYAKCDDIRYIDRICYRGKSRWQT